MESLGSDGLETLIYGREAEDSCGFASRDGILDVRSWQHYFMILVSPPSLGPEPSSPFVCLVFFFCCRSAVSGYYAMVRFEIVYNLGT
jgi:hypothetical protein